jgi:hypothetical protein
MYNAGINKRKAATYNQRLRISLSLFAIKTGKFPAKVNNFGKAGHSLGENPILSKH